MEEKESRHIMCQGSWEVMCLMTKHSLSQQFVQRYQILAILFLIGTTAISFHLPPLPPQSPQMDVSNLTSKLYLQQLVLCQLVQECTHSQSPLSLTQFNTEYYIPRLRPWILKSPKPVCSLSFKKHCIWLFVVCIVPVLQSTVLSLFSNVSCMLYHVTQSSWLRLVLTGS